jgi:SAM-dependent methyltransferase
MKKSFSLLFIVTSFIFLGAGGNQEDSGFSNDSSSKEKEVKFYTSKQGAEIMTESNYTAAIKRFLYNENRAVVKLLFSSHYDKVVEVGCAQAQKASMFVELGYRYLGIDINPVFIATAKESIERNGLEKNADVECTSVFDFENEMNHSLKATGKGLVIFPFNLFGNLPDHEQLLKKFLGLNYDIFISTYTTDNEAFKTRKDYYSNCQFENLSFESSNEKCTFFSSDGLSTTAYSREYYQNLIETHFDKDAVSYQIDKFDPIGFSIVIKIKGKGDVTLDL